MRFTRTGVAQTLYFEDVDVRGVVDEAQHAMQSITIGRKEQRHADQLVRHHCLFVRSFVRIALRIRTKLTSRGHNLPSQLLSAVSALSSLRARTQRRSNHARQNINSAHILDTTRGDDGCNDAAVRPKHVCKPNTRENRLKSEFESNKTHRPVHLSMRSAIAVSDVTKCSCASSRALRRTYTRGK
jgi:hypothetical protein